MLGASRRSVAELQNFVSTIQHGKGFHYSDGLFLPLFKGFS